MLWSLINRTILWELIKVFLLSLITITGLLLLAVVVIEAQNQGLGPWQILAIIPLVIPSTLPYTIPATTLFATCIVYGRLAHDNEILAIKSAGINVLHVVVPATLLGLLMSVATGALYHEVIPKTYHMMKTLFLKDIENVLYGMLKRDGFFKHPKLDYVIYVQKVEGRKLIKPLFMHRIPGTLRYDVVAEAREAELRVDMVNHKVLVHMRHCYITSEKGDVGYVEEKIWPVNFPPDIRADRKYRRSDMSWNEIHQRLQHLNKDLRKTQEQIAINTALFTTSHPPDNLTLHLKNLRALQKATEGEIRSLQVELQRRPALALGCLCFVLVGCPVGIWFSRSDYLSAFVTCFLPIVLVYYPLILCGENLARAGTLDPVISVWAANIVMGVISLVLYWRLLKH